MPLVASRDVGAELSSWRSAALSLEPLAHAVSADAPRGVVEVVAALRPSGADDSVAPKLELPLVQDLPTDEPGTTSPPEWPAPAEPALSSPVATPPAPPSAPPTSGVRHDDVPPPAPPRPETVRPVRALRARPAPRREETAPSAPTPVELPVLRFPARPAPDAGPGGQVGREPTIPPQLPVLPPADGEHVPLVGERGPAARTRGDVPSGSDPTTGGDGPSGQGPAGQGPAGRGPAPTEAPPAARSGPL
ncbi:MAG TPA: hypothetical protein VGR90_11355, partial [Acidimicrobiales bacterium]|nr:hypothetical protein [Acidimicrobiales bacterium]